MPGLSDTLAEIDALKLGEELVYTHIAEKHGLSRTTLWRAHRGVQVPRQVDVFSNRKLNNQQEDELVKYIERLTTRHLPPTRTMVQRFESTVAQGRVSESWVTRFL
jgi:hypothetical protein